ncbi:hypothetical protein LOD99_12747 [Oopsacas minuta]|uniref:Phosphatidylinositol N-acetylglucosaminyltransferase subunit H n=1 Tax=Oopsacas minuta TaxID=111878 RepID=A0AAV7JD54_9METZ|nr:hypothetical protein LOD99_12747 [Oopsacas minuta]
MKSKSYNSYTHEKGKNINGDYLEVDKWVSELLEGKIGKLKHKITRIRISYTKIQVFKYILCNLIIAMSLSILMYFLTYWYSSFAIGVIYMFIVLTTIVLSEEVVIVHGEVIQTVVRYICWPLSHRTYLCENIDIVCVNEGFRRQRVIFYLMLVMKTLGDNKQKEHIVLYENILPNLDVVRVVLDVLRRAIGDRD